MTFRVRFFAMRFLLVLTVSLFFFATLHGQVESPRRKKGGFTGATPKPAAKQSVDEESSPPESTPKPKKKGTAESTPKPKKSSSGEESSTHSTQPESTPRPKKSAAVESTPKPAKVVADSEGDVVPKKKHKTPTDETTSEPKKADAPETPAKSVETEPPAKREHAPAATLEPGDLAEFAAQPPRVQALVTAALELTKLNLTYTYGSDDPAKGGMDCSGTMSHLLHSQGFKDVPRDSSSQYVWARKAGPFFAVVSKSAESFEFKDLQPGDLLFWTGTYETGREIPISHVMLYLGTEKKRKKRVMFGSSDGRSYDGIQRWGVSVFDFKMPNGNGSNGEPSKVDFVGYGKIPELRTGAINIVVDDRPAAETKESTEEKASSTPAPKRRSTKVSTTKSGKKIVD